MKAGTIKVHLKEMAGGRYFLAAEMLGEIAWKEDMPGSLPFNPDDPAAGLWKDFLAEAEPEKAEPYFLEADACRKLLLGRHPESFYGALAEEASLDGTPGITVNAWELVSFFAKEPFNRLFGWDWDERGEAALAASDSIYEAILAKDWMPDFSSLSEGAFRWRLPDRVTGEFSPSFWEQPLPDGRTVRSFVADLYHRALQSYLEKNSRLQSGVEEKIRSLLSANPAPRLLSTYFDEDSWKEWLGLKGNPLPFTPGLRLKEPNEMGEPWELAVVLRGKDRPLLVDKSDEVHMPDEWIPYLSAIEKEEEKWIRLFPWLKGKNGIASQLTETEAWLFLTEASECLLALGVEILLPAWWNALKNRNPFQIKAKLKGQGTYRPSFVGLDALLDYQWRISIGGADFSEEAFSKLVEENRGLVKIQGQWIPLDPGFVKHIQQLMEKAEKQGIHVRELIEQELSGKGEDGVPAEEGFPTQVEIEPNEYWKGILRRLKDWKQIPEAPVPNRFRGELRPYQKQGMSWLLFLRDCRFGACLADDMGLGKTVQLIAYLLAVKEKGESPPGFPALIICPTSVLGNWEKEIQRFAPDLRVYVHYGANRLKENDFSRAVREADVVLTSYALAHLDLADLERVQWSTIAIDEAQNIKNPQTKQSRAVRKLRGQHHIALTGTPMENRLSELWTIFDFIYRGYLGSQRQFQKRFMLPIEKENNKDKIEQLKKRIRPFLLRRTKQDPEVALNLPEKLEQKEYSSRRHYMSRSSGMRSPGWTASPVLSGKGSYCSF